MEEQMPKYSYRCNTCKNKWDEWHSMSETVEKCAECDSPFVFRIPSHFTTMKTEQSGDRKVGEATKEGIEDNREVLKQMKEEARTREFDPNA
jgi:putative FmdB family regulatory protein